LKNSETEVGTGAGNVLLFTRNEKNAGEVDLPPAFFFFFVVSAFS
jgi:hypothetical protein